MLKFRVPAAATKVYRTAAFAPLAFEIKRFGALLKSEAEALYGRNLVSSALQRRICVERDTKIGKVVYLLLKGRKLVGMAGMFVPSDDSLMDAICFRQAVLKLEESGFELDLTTRKRSIIYQDAEKKILALAQHDGYNFAAVRRLYKVFIDTNEYSEIHIYNYMEPEELEKLARTLYTPSAGSKPLSRERLHLHRLDVPKARPKAVKSQAVNN